MSNWVDLRMDVLASSPDEINKIERAREELIAWRAQKTGEDPKEIAGRTKEIVSLKPNRNLGILDSSMNRAGRFEGTWKDKFWGLVWSHVHFVSRDFPKAVFLAAYWDDCMSYGGKIVIHAGDEIRSSYDGDHHAQGIEWVLPNIFAPFRAEYELGLECGSLWDEWVEGMRRHLAVLAERYGNAADLAQELKDEFGVVTQNEEKL